MKRLIGIVILFSSVAFGQQLTDVAISKGVTSIQYSFDHLANGMSFYDFDQDGWDDLTMPLNNNSVVFYRNVNGTFQTFGSPITTIGTIREIIWVDINEDEALDLCVTYAEVGIRLYKNDGNFNFTDVTAISGVTTSLMNPYGVNFADINNDGYLDFYVSNYSGAAGTFSEENILYINQGNGTFGDSTLSAGVGNASQPSFMAMWYDYDEDNDLDLHVINDKNGFDDAFYRNNGDLTFTDIAVSMGVDNTASDPMGMAVSDYNNDGYQDIYISDVGASNPYFTSAEDGKLFHNLSGTGFTNVTPAAGLDTSVMGWGVLWVDYNNDGFEDLYVATSRLDSTLINEETSVFFVNNTQGSFTLINDSINGDIVCSSYAPVKGDINNDGFYDIVVLNDGVHSNVLENSGNSNNYIKITPIGAVSNYQAIGSKVRVYTQGIQQYQVVTCGSGICSQNSQHMIFGVGPHTVVDSISILFPSGIEVKKYNLAVDTSYLIEEKVQTMVELFPGISDTTICQGDSIILNATAYQNILWNTGSTDSLITVYNDGTYSFEAENMTGDTLYISSSLTISIEETPTYQIVVNNPECGLENAGSATLLFIAPPASEFEINWTNGDQGIFMDSVPGGTYSYTIMSTNNCIYQGSVTITENPLFDVQYLTTPATDDSLGTIQFFIFGGVGPFIYELDSTQVGSTITGLPPGNYEVLVTDANGCEVIVPFTISDQTTADLSVNTKLPFMILYTDGGIQIQIDTHSELEDISICSLIGKKVTDFEDFSIIEVGKWKLLPMISSGIYIISIKINGEYYSERILVH